MAMTKWRWMESVANGAHQNSQIISVFTGKSSNLFDCSQFGNKKTPAIQLDQPVFLNDLTGNAEARMGKLTPEHSVVSLPQTTAG